MILIGIGGCSSSGKTTVSTYLERILDDGSSPSNVHVLRQDDFFKEDDDKREDWDCPDAIDFDTFISLLEKTRNLGNVEHLKTLKSKEPPSTIDEDVVVKMKRFWNELAPKDSILRHQPILLVDGFLLYHDDRLRNLFDLRVFIDAPKELLNERRQKRKYRVGDEWFYDPPNYFEIVWKNYLKYNTHVFENTSEYLMVSSGDVELEDILRTLLSGISENLQPNMKT